MKKILALALVSLLHLAILTTTCPAAMTKKPAVTVIGGFLSPESVVADPSGSRFFVSNVGEKLAPMARDGDGFISEVSPDGRVLRRTFLPARGEVLNAPKGMAITGNILYVTDMDRIVGFDLETRKKVFELDLSSEKTAFLNDLVLSDDSTLFVSATDTGKIYRVSLGERPGYSLVAEGIRGPNGLFYDAEFNLLYVVGFGRPGRPDGELGVVFLSDDPPSYGALTRPLGFLDGVALLPDGRVIFSDWVSFSGTGTLRAYDLDTAKLSEVELSEDARGPADFFFDAKTGMLWLPRMVEGTVAVERLR